MYIKFIIYFTNLHLYFLDKDTFNLLSLLNNFFNDNLIQTYPVDIFCPFLIFLIFSRRKITESFTDLR